MRNTLLEVCTVFCNNNNLWLWGPLTAPQMVRGDHLWQPYLVRGDHPRQHILPQMVRGTYFGGDHLWHDRTPPKKILRGLLLSKSLTRTPRSLQGLLLTSEDCTKALSKIHDFKCGATVLRRCAR